MGDGYCKLSSPAVLHQEEYNVHVDCDFLLLLGFSWGPFLDVNMLLHPSLHLSAAPHYIQIYNVWYFYICHTITYIYIYTKSLCYKPSISSLQLVMGEWGSLVQPWGLQCQPVPLLLSPPPCTCLHSVLCFFFSRPLLSYLPGLYCSVHHCVRVINMLFYME